MALSKIKKSLKKPLFFTLVFLFSAQTLKVQALDDKLETNTTFENRSVLTEEGGVAPVGIQPRSAEWGTSINKVWFGGTDTDLAYAKNDIRIDKKIDYKNNTIHWTVEFNQTAQNWNYPFFYIFMPNHTNTVKIYKNLGQNVVRETDFNGLNNRWNHKRGSEEYLKEFDKRVIKYIHEDDPRMKEIKSNLNWFKDEKCSNVLISREGFVNSKVTWEFFTEHEPGTVLEKVPMIAGSSGHTATAPDAYPRGLAIGTFGMAARHDIPIPKTTYVNDPKKLTENEKKLVTKRVLEKVLETYKQNILKNHKPEEHKKEIVEFFGENVRLMVNGKETTIRYEEYAGGTKLRLLDGDGHEITDVNSIELVKDSFGDPILKEGHKISIDNDGRFNIRFKDDTIGTLDPFLYVKEKQLNVIPIHQIIKELDPIVEIRVEALGSVVFENSIKVDDLTLHEGLTLTKNGNKAVINGTINNVVFPPGKDTVDYVFKVRADDPINHMSVVKEVKITVTKNPGLVPVGTNERGYDFPIKLLSLGFLLTVFSLYNIKKRKFD